MADHGGGGEYSGGPADHGSGEEHPGGADHGDGSGYSRGPDSECGSRPLASESEEDIERQPSEEIYAYSGRIRKPKLIKRRVAVSNAILGFLAKLAKSIISLSKGLFYILIGTHVILGYIFIIGKTRKLLLKIYMTKTSSRSNGSVKSREPTIKMKMHELTIVALVRIGHVVFIWMVINLSVPSLKKVPFLGSQLWKWSLLATLALLGYPILFLHYLYIHLMSESTFSTFRGSNVEYCLTGLGQSMIPVQYFTTILIVWLLCVNTSNAPLHRYVSMTLASLLVGAVLSVVKSVVLLLWKTKLIYKKYKGKILLAGCQLYFHLLIVERHGWTNRELVVWGEPMDYKLESSSADSSEDEEPRVEDHDGPAAAKKQKIPPSEEHMLSKRVKLQYIHEISTYLTNNFELTLTEDDDIPNIIPTLRERFPGQEFSIDGMESQLCVFDKNLLQELLQAETQRVDATYEDFEKWMVDGLKNCYAVGNRINGAMEAMKLLNRVLTGLIVLVVVLIWIFITGFATTSVVVGLASMFLGLSFVFGDTCKTFFQGVIFSFVTHPFDVGDRCIIDDKELKVKKINILTTTFFGSQLKEVVIYPNSDLSNKHIVVLLHGEPASESRPKLHGIVSPQLTELEDVIELILPCSTKANHIESLQTKIEGYLEDGIESGNYKKPYWVTFNETEGGIKMGVHFHHNLNNGDEGDQLETPAIRKEKQRSKFFLQLRKLHEE